MYLISCHLQGTEDRRRSYVCFTKRDYRTIEIKIVFKSWRLSSLLSEFRVKRKCNHFLSFWILFSLSSNNQWTIYDKENSLHYLSPFRRRRREEVSRKQPCVVNVAQAAVHKSLPCRFSCGTAFPAWKGSKWFMAYKIFHIYSLCTSSLISQ